MNIRNRKLAAFALVFFATICIDQIRGCWVVERTTDRCRNAWHIWLASGIDQSTYKGGSTNTYVIPESQREATWFCGYNSKERVAWGGGANRLRVKFDGIFVYWEFLKCSGIDGCQTTKPPQVTSDKCRNGGHLWLEEVNRSVPKGTSSGPIEISRHMRELRWFCGYISDERVAWSGGANIMRVHFLSDMVSWEFFTCQPPVECYNTAHSSSLEIKLEKLTLKSAPTDNVFLGWEFLFGTPADEIVANLESKKCYTRSKAREIKQGQTLSFGDSVTLKSFREEPIKFWLTEEDGGFGGKNDLSELVTISKGRMDIMRDFLNNNPDSYYELDEAVTVQGQNIFKENVWFGFIADNLCINVLDIALGPWTGIGKKLAIAAAHENKIKLIGKFQSRNVAVMYKTIKTEHEAGTLMKRKFFKALMTYQFREAFSLKNVVKSGVKTSSKNIGEGVKELAFGDLQKQIQAMIDEAIQRGIYTLLGAQARDVYMEVNKALDQISSWMEKVTGAMEFCLSDVYPPERPALYHAFFTVKKSA